MLKYNNFNTMNMQYNQQYNPMNQMNNYYSNNFNFNNGFNQNNFNNNFQNYYMQNLMMQQNQMMMQQNSMMMQQNPMMMPQNRMMMNQNLMNRNCWSNLQEKMNQILNQYENGNNNPYTEEKQETEEERKEREEDERMTASLSEVIKEQIAQKQNFENLQPPPNLDYNEVDPDFMHKFISDRELFCGYAHNLTGIWAHGENRGGRQYNPPDGWIGFGLNVINKYDNGNNDWLACDGRPGEWCVAYHGACVHNTSEQIKQIIKPILENNLKPGAGQAYSSYDDACHPGHKVGVGVYCTPNPNVADGYSGQIDVNGHRYKVAFMLRVKPDKIRYSNSQNDYWVLNAGNGDFSEMRPYRFLIKKVS